MKSSLKKNENQKINDLKKVIEIGKQLKKDTTPDQKKLDILIARQETKNKAAPQAVVKKAPQAINTAALNNANIVAIPQKTPTTNTNQMIDLENEIKSITQDGNRISIKFNKKISKNDLVHKGYKQNGNYEYIFDINGKYKYTEPIKIQIEGIDKIVTTDNNKDTRIKIVNNSKPKISFMVKPDELIIMAEGEIENHEQKVTQVNTSVPKVPIGTKIEKSTQKVLEKPVVKVEQKNKDEVIIKETIQKEIAAPIQTKTAITKGASNKTIVIDAGHGGDDVGAVGSNKKYEKVINLEVAKYLASVLKQRGYKVYLTRTSDTFIKVMDRTILANQKNADLFISVHTNSIPKEKAASTSGIETFFLSPARSERAKRVAALENKTDIREMSESSKSVFLESLNRPRITASHKFAIDVQGSLLQAARNKYKDVKDSGVREGPFWVLVGAQMPSILVELGYISHPEEGRRLYEKDYQQLLANGIANGVDSYFSKNP